MQLDRRQRILLILFTAAGLAIILLAGGMAGVPFDAARAFSPRTPTGVLDFSDRSPDYRFLLFFYVFLLGAAVLTMFLTREGRRRALVSLAVMGVIGLFLYRFIDQLVFEPPVSPTPVLAAQNTGQPTETVPTPIPVLIEGDLPLQAPDWLVTAIGAVLAFMLAGALGLLFLVFGRRTPRRTLPADLAQEAEEAAAAIQSGEEIRDVILRCYHQMARRLEEERNLPRGSSVTPREFEHSLVRLGFPAEPVHTLTALFEAVRYGHVQANPEQTRQALESLQAIAMYVDNLGAQ